MGVSVSREELLAASEWVSAGESTGADCSAYVSRASGKVHLVGEGVDEEPPEDIEDGSVYIAVPQKSELELGRSLALRFAEQHLPASYEIVRQYFGSRGAYSRFKSLLERSGQLEAWHRYEEKAIEEALQKWCEEHGLSLMREPRSTDG